MTATQTAARIVPLEDDMKWTRQYDKNGDVDYVCDEFRITWCFAGMCGTTRKEWWLERLDGGLLSTSIRTRAP